MVTVRRPPQPSIHVVPRILPCVRHAGCAVATLALLATISPPRLDAQDLVASASPPPFDETTTVALPAPDAGVPARSVDLQHTPVAAEQGPLSVRDFRAGYAIGPATVGITEIGPEPADCANPETAAAGGRTAGGRACASPVRVKLLWW